MVKALRLTFDDGIQAGFPSSNNGIELAMICVVKHTLCKVVQSSHAHTVFDVEICSLVRPKAVKHTNVKSVLTRMGIIVPIARPLGKMMDRVVNEYHLRHMEETSTTVPDEEPSIERSLPPRDENNKITLSFSVARTPVVDVVVAVAHSGPASAKKTVSKGNYSISHTKSGDSSQCGSN